VGGQPPLLQEPPAAGHVDEREARPDAVDPVVGEPAAVDAAVEDERVAGVRELSPWL
jgi:hypothetical protein